MPGNEVFPALVSCTKLATNHRIYDVKFYPYSTVGDDQIFAAVAETDTFVCRPRLGQDPPFEVLRFFRDEAIPPASFNTLVWMKHPVTQNPLLCIAGHSPKHIKILDIESGQVVRTLSGHGRGVNDLAVSPLSTSLLASCAEDYTIRLWNLEAKYERQPCVAIFDGEGHRAPILAIHYHPNGKWILSGGIDTAICLWSVPSLKELERPERNPKSEDPKIIYYPHFFSKEVHANYIDSLAFYGDLIISRAAKDQHDRSKANEILIWKIVGFNSASPPPDNPPIPVPEERTRSSFPHDHQYRGFQRLLTLSMPNTDRFYHRFGLLHAPGMRPILAMGNQSSKYFFWDLQRLEEGNDPRDEKKNNRKPRGHKPLPPPPSNLTLENTHPTRSFDSRSSKSMTPDLMSLKNSETSSTPAASAIADRKTTTLGDRFKPIEAHYTRTAATKLSPNLHFATSQMAWSPDGTWLIGVGDYGMMCMFHRDKSVIGGPLPPS